MGESRVFFTCCSCTVHGMTELYDAVVGGTCPSTLSFLTHHQREMRLRKYGPALKKRDRWRLCGKAKEKLLLYPTCIVMEQPKTDTTQLSRDA